MNSDEKVAFINAQIEIMKAEERVLVLELRRDVYDREDIKEFLENFEAKWRAILGAEALSGYFQ